MAKLQQVISRMSKDIAVLFGREPEPVGEGSTLSSVQSKPVEDSQPWLLSPLTGFEAATPGLQPEDLDVIATKTVSDARKFRLMDDGPSPRAKRLRTEVDETAAFDEAFEW